MSKRNLTFAIVSLVLMSVLSAACAPQQTPTSPPVRTITLALGYRPDVQFSPFYMAIEQGYFAERGIEMEIQHIPENNALAMVGAGQLQFAVVSGEQVVLARSQGLPIVYVFEWFQTFPVGVVSPAELEITEPADLIGHKVGIPGLYGASYIGYRALLAAEGIDEDEIDLQVIGYNAVTEIYEGNVEASVIYVNNEPLQLEALGLDVNVIPVADYADLVSNGLVTNEDTIADDPDLVLDMVWAISRGLEDVINDPDAAFEVSRNFVETITQGNEDVQRRVLEESIKLWTAARLGET